MKHFFAYSVYKSIMFDLNFNVFTLKKVKVKTNLLLL